MSTSPKVVLITGGSSGIGLACAKLFVAQKWQVAITGRNAETLNEAFLEISTSQNQLLTIVADVSRPEDCAAMVQQTVAHFGRLDCLINNAGISMRALFEEVQMEAFFQVMDINFKGMVYATKLALPHITAAKGNIIAISSIAGYRGLPGRTAYSASKFAMNGFMEALRLELKTQGVHVGVVSPGFTASNIRKRALKADGSPQGDSPLQENKLMSAEEVAEAIYGAVIHRKREVVLTTQGKLTVWVNKLLPTLADKLVFNHFKKEKDSPIGR
jgi:NAD(P)-dependent dehydrogenase (short-subunit alcohol dehydrogenase family)